jgi:hypothetical protein
MARRLIHRFPAWHQRNRHAYYCASADRRLIQIKSFPKQGRYYFLQLHKVALVMTKPICERAEVALEYPDKLYIGSFAHTARFDAHLDQTGISLTLELPGPDEQRKSVRMHFHYALFADILRDLATTVAAIPTEDLLHRDSLRDAAKALYLALETNSK